MITGGFIELRWATEQNHVQRTRGVIITSLLRQNDVATSIWRNNDVIIASYVRWASTVHPTKLVNEKAMPDMA